eukprot:m.224855 g.224855  ORF g.224855 m.224855 type:complete len:62 (+) comp22342_c0_seq10:1014-1199(+)
MMSILCGTGRLCNFRLRWLVCSSAVSLQEKQGRECRKQMKRKEQNRTEEKRNGPKTNFCTC